MSDVWQRHKSKSFTLRLSDRLATRLREAARADDRTISEFVREILRRELAGDVSRGGDGSAATWSDQNADAVLGRPGMSGSKKQAIDTEGWKTNAAR